MTLHDIANRLSHVTWRDETFMAQCPAHEDRKPSLSGSTGKEDERVLLYCQAGCATDAVLSAMRLTYPDLYPSPRTVTTPTLRSSSSTPTTYDYLDLDGTVLHQVVRGADKSFRQRRPNGTGGWTWKASGRRVPYRWSELVGQSTVWIVEGEKDVDSCWERGLAATCNLGGAGKWGAGETQALVDLGVAQVYVVPDADVPGRRHAQTVVAAFTAAQVPATLVALPGLTSHGDVSDWWAAGGTVQELQALAASPAPVLSDLLDSIQYFIHRFVVLSHAQEVVLAIWVAHTYVLHACFTVTPYLNLTSATKGSGKTRLLEVLNYLVKNPWMTARVSPAVLARKVHAAHPTLLLDEVDALFKGEQDGAELVRGVLNSGYKASGSASCCEGKDFKVKDFNTFSAKCLAGIGSALPDTVADRSLRILIKKRTQQEQAAARTDPSKRFRKRDVQPDVDRITQSLEAWASATSVIDALAAAQPGMPTGLHDRAEEVLEPLFAVAELAGDAWPARLRQATPLLMAQASNDDIRVLLLWDIHEVLEDRDCIDFIRTSDLVSHLNRMDDKPWPTCGKRGEPLTAHRLARMLKDFEVFPAPNATGQTRGYHWDSFEDAWSRHPSPEAVKASECQYPNENGPIKPDRTDGLTLAPPAQRTDTVLRNGCTRVFPTSNPPLAWVSPKAENDRLGAILQQPDCHFRVEGHSVTLTPGGALSESAAAYVADHVDALRQRLLAMPS